MIAMATENPLFQLEPDQIDYLREGFESSQGSLSPYAARDTDAVYENRGSVAGGADADAPDPRDADLASLESDRGFGGLFAQAARDAARERRLSSEAPYDPSGQLYLRSPYVADVDRVLNNPFFTRTFDKTQVFSLYRNDNISRRGFHIQLVAQTAMKIGRALRLNVPLIEAIGLGHDAGHTPFGHAGEHFLSEIYHERTGRYFNHNVHSVRALRSVARCNLSLQTYNGMLCHCGENNFAVYTTDPCPTFEALDEVMEQCYLRKGYSSCLRPSTLEGCVVRISDIIAYIGKDRQDAIRAGLADEDTFADGLGGAYNAWALKVFANDVIEHSVGRPYIAMSEEGFSEMRRAKRENYEKIYRASDVDGEFDRGMGELFHRLYEHVVDDLLAGRTESPVFRHHIRIIDRGLSFYDRHYPWEDDPDLTAVDYISSMTDDYFMAVCEHYFPGAYELFPRREHF